jgi:hypothetical protein
MMKGARRAKPDVDLAELDAFQGLAGTFEIFQPHVPVNVELCEWAGGVRFNGWDFAGGDVEKKVQRQFR